MPSTVLEMKGVRKVYRMGDCEVHALKGIDLSINGGEMISIMGPSGCGKSTLLQIVGCLDKPTTGQVWITGTEIEQLDDDRLAKIRNKNIGFIFQSFNLLPHEDAISNVVVPLQYSGVSRKEAMPAGRKALEAVGLGDRLHHKPNELSGGQRQRVAIARAIVNEPSIVLADEPTGALDQKSGKEVMGILQRLNSEGRTIVMVTHDAKLANFSKRVVELCDGQITRDSPVGSPQMVSKQEVDAGSKEVPASINIEVCPKCGFGNRPKSKFCAYCGFPSAVVANVTDTVIGKIMNLKVNCPRCGTLNRAFAKYCVGCGTVMIT